MQNFKVITAVILLIDYFLIHIFLFFSRYSVVGYTLLLSLIEYKTLVMRGDLERANEILPSIPKEHHNRFAFSICESNHESLPGFLFVLYLNTFCRSKLKLFIAVDKALTREVALCSGHTF